MIYSQEDLELIRKIILSPSGLRVVKAVLACKAVGRGFLIVQTAIDPSYASYDACVGMSLLREALGRGQGEALARMAWAGIKVVAGSRRYHIAWSGPGNNALCMSRAEGGKPLLLEILSHEDFQQILEFKGTGTGGTARTFKGLDHIEYLEAK